MSNSIPSVQELAEQSRLFGLLASHPLLREKMQELKAQEDARRAARITALKSQIAAVEQETARVVARLQAANTEIESLTARYHAELRKLSAHRDEIQSRHHQLINARREAHHEIQRLEGTRHGGPLITWEEKAPDWFEAQVQEQRKQIPSSTFAPRRGESAAYPGNTK